MRSDLMMRMFLLFALSLTVQAAAPECMVLAEDPDVAALRAVYAQPPACWPAPHVDEGVQWQELAALPPRRTVDPRKAELGRQLFFERRLSGSGQIPCAHCHDPDLAWGDGRRHPFGDSRREGTRNSPSLLNVSSQHAFFWDGRAPDLQAQMLEAIRSPLEMNAAPRAVERALRGVRSYRDQFRAVYGTREIRMAQVTDALAEFLATLSSRPAAFDRFMQGEPGRLTDQQIEGLHLFRTRARCINCHHGALFTDGGFHNIGLHYYGRKYEDLGRYHVTGLQADVGAFKTPSLRDVLLTGPWMHNGLLNSLPGIVNFYNAGGFQPRPREGEEPDPRFPQLSPHIRPLQLDNDERAALLAFLAAISTRPTRIGAPEDVSP